MTLSRDKTPDSVRSEKISRKRLQATGLCINCGNKVTLCGRPFTADIRCNNCHVINHFEMSQQPVSFRTMDSNANDAELS